MTRHRIIINPTAGRGSAKKLTPLIEQELTARGLDFETVFTAHPWHAAELAQQAVVLGFDVIVSVGGDGTANEVLNGLMLAREAGLGSAAMGVLPIGRGNDFAWSMGIPTELKESCRVLAEGKRITIDTGCVSGGLYPMGRYFGNGVGIGFDAVVGFFAKEMTHLSGFPSYLAAAVKTMNYYHPAPVMEIDMDDETVTQSTLMVSIMNGRRMGGGFLMTPDSLPDDALMDLCIAAEIPRARIPALIARVLRGTQAGHSAIQMKRSSRIAVRAVKGVLPAHCDGETLCTDGTELIIQTSPYKLELVSSPRPAA